VSRLRRTAGGAGSGLLTVGLILTCFAGNWRYMGVPVPLDRIAIIGGLLLSLIAAERRMPWRPFHAFMVLALAWTIVSAISVRQLSGDGLFALIDRFGALPFLLCVAAPAAYATEGSRRFLGRAFTVFGIYLGVEAAGQVLGLSFLVWPHYILDPSIGIHFDRARGPFVEAVADGMMCTYCAAIAGYVSLVDRSRRWRTVGWAAMLLCLLSVYMTLTRAVWIGAALALIVVVLVVPKFRRRGFGALGALTVAGVAVYVAFPALADAANARSDDQLPVWDRLNTNAAAIRMVIDQPLNGIGWHMSATRMVEYVRQGADYPVTTASGEIEIHNVFLSRAAELGIPGFALWLAAFTSAILFAVLRRPESPDLQPWRVVLVAVVIGWGTAAMLGPVPYVQPNYLIWVLAGVVLRDYLIAPRSDLTRVADGGRIVLSQGADRSTASSSRAST
jgi:putative inorganic carbon (hco3(-)) transporter